MAENKIVLKAYEVDPIKKKLKRIYYITLASLVFLVVAFVVLRIIYIFLPSDITQLLETLSLDGIETKSEAFKAYVASFGYSASFAFIALQIVQVIVAPIPGQFSGLLGGYVFGFWEGLSYTLIGLSIGSFITMVLGRLFGIAVLHKLLPQKILVKYDYLLTEDSLKAFFIIFLLPYFPDDAICFIAGLTRIKLWKLMVVCVVGRLPGMATFSYVGANIYENTTEALVMFGAVVVLSTLYWLFDGKITAFLKK